MRAGVETLDLLDDQAYRRLEETSARLQSGLDAAAVAAGVQLTSNRVGSMMTAFFGVDRVTDYRSAAAADTERYGRFFHAMLAGGVYLAPSQFEALFPGLAHTYADIDATIEAASQAFASLG
jgi:glutamate-1-semialdehyde 2,1-aminomutase